MFGLDDADCQNEMVWGLNGVMNNSDDAILSLVFEQAPLTFLKTCIHKSGDLAVPALRALGNLSSAEEPAIPKAMLQAGVLRELHAEYGNNLKNNRKEVFWTLSNLACTDAASAEQVLNSNLFTEGLLLIQSGTYNETMKEVIWTVANTFQKLEDDMIIGYVSEGNQIVEQLTGYLSQEMLEPKSIDLVLSTLGEIFSTVEHGSYEPSTNPLMTFQDREGLEIGAKLQTHPNKNIYEKVTKLLQKYFPEEEEDVAM